MQKKFKPMLLLGSALLIGLLALLPIVVNSLEHSGNLSETQNQRATQIMALTDGNTFYSDEGQESGRCVILVHGASGPKSVWDKVSPALQSAGYRVISYDLFGRGFSDRPRQDNNPALFRRQLSEVIQQRQCAEKVVLVGSSMGAIIVADFAVSTPEKVDRVALIGPAGFPIKASPAAKLLQIPWIGEYVIAAFGKGFLVKHNAKYYSDPSKWPEAATDYAEQFKYSGFKSALLSTMREMPMQDFRDGYIALGSMDIPTALIWGRDDMTFPVTNFDDARKYLKPSTAVIVEGAAHVPQYEKAEQTATLLIEFFQRL